MDDEMLIDISNGFCGIRMDNAEWEFCRAGNPRIFIDRLELQMGKLTCEFEVKTHAAWRNGQWIETFRVRGQFASSEAIGYILHGDRDIVGILRSEKT